MIDTLVTIDDERIDQKLYRRIVKRSGLVSNHYQFYDGPSALDFIADETHPPIDVILLDINMPGMTGFDFLDTAHARFGDRFARMAVMMLTTSVAPEDKARAAQYAVVKDYIHKPLEPAHITAIDTWLHSG